MISLVVVKLSADGYVYISSIVKLTTSVIINFNRLMQNQKSSDQNNTNPHQNGPFKRTFTNKVVRLRENYIIARDNHANHAKIEVEQLLNSPKFNRFISLKKYDIQNSQALLAKYKIHEQIQRKPLEKNFNRRQLYFMRQRRPQHNSPIKTKQEDILLRQLNKTETKNKELVFIPSKNIPPPQNESQNTLFIKNLVTHMEQPRKARKHIENPYSPPSSNKYYVAELIKNYTNMDSLVRDHLDNSIYFLQLFAKYNQPCNQPQVYPLSLRQKDKYKGKITVVFDLDETLVHCFEDRSQPHQLQLPVRFSGGREMIAPINIRPGAKELLAELSQDFEIMIFTASHQSYADEVINYLDPTREYVQHRLYRRNCQCIEDTYYIKDLRVIGRDMSKIVLVDNAAYSYCFQFANGIPIIPYYQGDDDYQLKALKEYLLDLKGVQDVREYNKQTFRLQQYVRFNNVDELVSELYL